jgi:hypothetical protein
MSPHEVYDLCTAQEPGQRQVLSPGHINVFEKRGYNCHRWITSLMRPSRTDPLGETVGILPQP